MNPLSTAGRCAYLLAGTVTLQACTAATSTSISYRDLYPNYPAASDILAHDPCSIKREPDIIVKDEYSRPAEPTLFEALSERTWSADEAKARVLKSVNGSLEMLRRINPVFLCGLERIEILGEKAYAASLEPGDRRSSTAHYDHDELVLRLRLYGNTFPIIHETAHHIHNLGILAPTIREFLSTSWKLEQATDQWVRTCESVELCFRSNEAAMTPGEDWARTFEGLVIDPISAWIEMGFSLAQVPSTPLETKLQILTRDIPFEQPLRGRVSIGKVQQLEASHFQILDGSKLYLSDITKRNLSAYQLRGSTFQENLQEVGLPQLFTNSDIAVDADRWEFMGERAGPWLFLVGRKEPFNPLRFSNPLGIQISNVVDKKAGKRLLLGKQPVLGRYGSLGDTFYFFQGAPGRLSLSSLHPHGDKPTLVQEWSFDKRWNPVHVVPLNGKNDLAVLAYNKEKTNLLYTEATIIRIQKKGSNSNVRIAGKYERFDGEYVKAPIHIGAQLIFPVFNAREMRFGFLAYDLSKEKFFPLQLDKEAIPPELSEAAVNQKIASLQILPGPGDTHYLIVAHPKSATLIAPVEFKLK